MTDFAKLRDQFHLPDGMIYLDGNSLGPLPIRAQKALSDTAQNEWGGMLIGAWNKADWMNLPNKLGKMIAPILGNPKGQITCGDTLSIKVYQALHAALSLRPDRKIVLSDSGNFPSDLYIAHGLLDTLGGYELRIVAPEDIEDAIDENTAALLLTHVDYRTGRIHDMERITTKAHAQGAVMIWDLAHSAGALPTPLGDAEFAVGCTYKYLNGGPGAPAFIYMREDIIAKIDPALCGWLGHEAPFEFDLDYRPAPSIDRMRVGTPPILQMRALEAALEIWKNVDIYDIRTKSIELSEHFITRIEADCPDLTLASPRDPNARGSQVSFAVKHAYPLVQALIAQGVVGDFRAPNIARFGFTPMYLSQEDIDRACDIIKDVVQNQLWDRDIYKAKNTVT